jgi:hypothetical protein
MQQGTVSGPEPRGAYGFRISGLDDADEFLGPASADWPLLQIIREPAPAEGPAGPGAGTVEIDEAGARLWIGERDWVEVDRATMTVRFATREPLSDQAILHPFLGLPASFASHWLGRQVFHGGGFVHAGGAWALLGDKEVGKSSTLGSLLQRGFGVLSDDILVVEGRTLFAGPHCVDLRGEAATVMGGERLGIVGSRERWRLHCGDVGASAELAGVIHLEWGDEIAIEPLAVPERLSGLITHSVVRPGAGADLALLELAVLPTWRFTRPRDLGALEAAVGALLGALG